MKLVTYPYFHVEGRGLHDVFSKFILILAFIGSVGLVDFGIIIFDCHFLGEKRSPKWPTATPTICLPLPL